MSEYLSKKAVLEHIRREIGITERQRDAVMTRRMKEFHGGAIRALQNLEHAIQSGAFDADNAEIQRLRAALEEVRECLDDFWDRDTPRRLYKEVRRFAGQIHVMEKAINQALSTTTEPTNAEKVERVREGDGNDA